MEKVLTPLIMKKTMALGYNTYTQIGAFVWVIASLLLMIGLTLKAMDHSRLLGFILVAISSGTAGFIDGSVRNYYRERIIVY